MKQNKDELKEMRRLEKQFGIDWFSVITVNTGYNLLTKDEEYVPENPKHRRYTSKNPLNGFVQLLLVDENGLQVIFYPMRMLYLL